MEEIDFTQCQRVAGRAYNGANGKKIAVRHNGEVWILKFPADVRERPNELSCSNGCISEHLGCSVFRMAGIEVQETMLGTFVNGKRKTVCACKDFTSPGVRLHDFCSIKNSVLCSENGGTGTELGDVLTTIDNQTFVDTVEVKRRFWQMFVVDALLGNFDRHNGNWGFLVNEETGDARLAPVFDCGSCLLPQADDKIMEMCLKDESEMNARIYSFPSSMLKIEGKKIGYYEYLHSEKADDGLREAMGVLVPRIEAMDFSSLINETPYLTDLQREFYLRYMERRRRCMFR